MLKTDKLISGKLIKLHTSTVMTQHSQGNKKLTVEEYHFLSAKYFF